MDEQLNEYRTYLRQAHQMAQENFDKTVLSLSGGALGISFAFIKDIVGPDALKARGLLYAAWLSWGISVTLVLASFYSSQRALHRALCQLESSNVEELQSAKLGGFADRITWTLNALAGILFLVGVILLTIFVRQNWR